MFFDVGSFFSEPRHEIFLTQDEAQYDQYYNYFLGWQQNYSMDDLNAKPKVTSCLKNIYASGFSSAQVMATNDEGNVVFSSYGSWDDWGQITEMRQVFSPHEADLKITVPAKAARQWIENRDVQSAVSALFAGPVKVEPSWAPYALWVPASGCFYPKR